MYVVWSVKKKLRRVLAISTYQESKWELYKALFDAFVISCHSRESWNPGETTQFCY